MSNAPKLHWSQPSRPRRVVDVEPRPRGSTKRPPQAEDFDRRTLARLTRNTGILEIGVSLGGNQPRIVLTFVTDGGDRYARNFVTLGEFAPLEEAIQLCKEAGVAGGRK